MAHPSDDTTDIEENNETKNGKKTTRKRQQVDPYETYNTAARTITRCIDLWCNMDQVISTIQLIQQDEASKLGDLDEEDAARQVHEELLGNISPDLKEHVTRTYYKIVQLVPGLQSLVENPEKKAEVGVITQKMNATIKAVRSNDATHLKTYIAQYASPDPYKPGSLNPPIVVTSGRAELGLNHFILARWLCPADQLDRFDKDPEQARKDLASGVMPMRSEDFPCLFWSGEMPGQDYDADNMLHGLFKSYFLVRVGRHIFLGPSSAFGGDTRTTRSCNAVLHNMSTVQAEHIGYICIQARFAISSRSQWGEKDGNLSYFKMYHNIVHFIRDSPDQEWRDELLRWWNKELFGDEKGRSETRTRIDERSDSATPEQMSTIQRLQAQMKARLATPTPSSCFAINPLLVSGSVVSSGRAGASTSVPLARAPTLDTSTEFSFGLTPSSSLARMDPPLVSGSVVSSGHAGASTSAPLDRAPTPDTSTTESRGINVTPPRREVTPLTELEEDMLPLTPITNKKGKQMKAAKGKGKRPANQGDDVAGASHPKRSERSRA